MATSSPKGILRKVPAVFVVGSSSPNKASFLGDAEEKDLRVALSSRRALVPHQIPTMDQSRRTLPLHQRALAERFSALETIAREHGWPDDLTKLAQIPCWIFLALSVESVYAGRFGLPYEDLAVTQSSVAASPEEGWICIVRALGHALEELQKWRWLKALQFLLRHRQEEEKAVAASRRYRDKEEPSSTRCCCCPILEAYRGQVAPLVLDLELAQAIHSGGEAAVLDLNQLLSAGTLESTLEERLRGLVQCEQASKIVLFFRVGVACAYARAGDVLKTLQEVLAIADAATGLPEVERSILRQDCDEVLLDLVVWLQSYGRWGEAQALLMQLGGFSPVPIQEVVSSVTGEVSDQNPSPNSPATRTGASQAGFLKIVHQREISRTLTQWYCEGVLSQKLATLVQMLWRENSPIAGFLESALTQANSGETFSCLIWLERAWRALIGSPEPVGDLAFQGPWDHEVANQIEDLLTGLVELGLHGEERIRADLYLSGVCGGEMLLQLSPMSQDSPHRDRWTGLLRKQAGPVQSHRLRHAHHPLMAEKHRLRPWTHPEVAMNLFVTLLRLEETGLRAELIRDLMEEMTPEELSDLFCQIHIERVRCEQLMHAHQEKGEWRIYQNALCELDRMRAELWHASLGHLQRVQTGQLQRYGVSPWAVVLPKYGRMLEEMRGGALAKRWADLQEEQYDQFWLRMGPVLHAADRLLARCPTLAPQSVSSSEQECGVARDPQLIQEEVLALFHERLHDVEELFHVTVELIVAVDSVRSKLLTLEDVQILYLQLQEYMPFFDPTAPEPPVWVDFEELSEECVRHFDALKKSLLSVLQQNGQQEFPVDQKEHIAHWVGIWVGIMGSWSQLMGRIPQEHGNVLRHWQQVSREEIQERNGVRRVAVDVQLVSVRQQLHASCQALSEAVRSLQESCGEAAHQAATAILAVQRAIDDAWNGYRLHFEKGTAALRCSSMRPRLLWICRRVLFQTILEHRGRRLAATLLADRVGGVIPILGDLSAHQFLELLTLLLEQALPFQGIKTFIRSGEGAIELGLQIVYALLGQRRTAVTRQDADDVQIDLRRVDLHDEKNGWPHLQQIMHVALGVCARMVIDCEDKRKAGQDRLDALGKGILSKQEEKQCEDLYPDSPQRRLSYRQRVLKEASSRAERQLSAARAQAEFATDELINLLISCSKALPRECLRQVYRHSLASITHRKVQQVVIERWIWRLGQAEETLGKELMSLSEPRREALLDTLKSLLQGCYPTSINDRIQGVLNWARSRHLGERELDSRAMDALQQEVEELKGTWEESCKRCMFNSHPNHMPTRRDNEVLQAVNTIMEGQVAFATHLILLWSDRERWSPLSRASRSVAVSS